MSPLTSTSKHGIDAKSYGINPATNRIAKIGDSVGIIAAQSIGEPGTQLTMRTFHIGGVASGGFKTPEIRVRSAGKVRYRGLRLVQTAEGGNIVLNKTGSIQILDEEGKELETYNIVVGSFLHVGDGAEDRQGRRSSRCGIPYNIPVLSEKGGTLAFKDMIPGVTVKRELDESSGRIATVVIEHKEDLNPQIEVRDAKNKPLAAYSIPVGAQIAVNEGDTIAPGALLAKTPRQASKTKDITGGLPRVAELFEARRPKDAAEMARIDGIVSFEGTIRGKRKLVVKNEETQQEEEHLIPHGKHIIVQPGDVVHKGQHLTEGAADPHEILEILGPAALYEFLIGQVQEVYRLQGVTINDKHIEIIIRQMLRKVRITDPGDSEYFWGEQVDRAAFLPREPADRGGGRQARRGRADPARHHQGLARDGELHLGRLVPGDDARPHRRRHPRQGGPAQGLQGERHHGSPDPGRHGPAAVQAAAGSPCPSAPNCPRSRKPRRRPRPADSPARGLRESLVSFAKPRTPVRGFGVVRALCV